MNGSRVKHYIGGIVALAIWVSVIFLLMNPFKTDYVERLTEMLNQNGQVKTSDVFDFDFSRAYVLKGSYLNGESVNKEYNLGVSIEEVDACDTDYVRRIVFVDENGEFVYEFRYTMGELIPCEEGKVIYPDTILEKDDSTSSDILRYRILSTEYY